MKVLILALALTCVAATEDSSRNVINNVVINILENHFNRLSENDPQNIPHLEGSYHLPGAPNIFGVRGSVSDVRADGYSNVIINQLGLKTSGPLAIQLTFPSIYGSVGNAEGSVAIFSYSLTASGSASGTVKGVRATATAFVFIVEGAINVDNINVEIDLDSLEAEVDVSIGRLSLGPQITRVLNNIPRYLNDYRRQISAVLNYVAGRLVDRYL